MIKGYIEPNYLNNKSVLIRNDGLDRNNNKTIEIRGLMFLFWERVIWFFMYLSLWCSHERRSGVEKIVKKDKRVCLYGLRHLKDVH